MTIALNDKEKEPGSDRENSSTREYFILEFNLDTFGVIPEGFDSTIITGDTN